MKDQNATNSVMLQYLGIGILFGGFLANRFAENGYMTGLAIAIGCFIGAFILRKKS